MIISFSRMTLFCGVGLSVGQSDSVRVTATVLFLF